MLRPMSSGVRGNSSDALKSQFQFLKDQEMTIDPNDACAMLFKLGAQLVSAISSIEADLAESRAAAANAAREAASLRQDLLSRENLLAAYNKLDFIKSSMSVSALQTSINNIGIIKLVLYFRLAVVVLPAFSLVQKATSKSTIWPDPPATEAMRKCCGRRVFLPLLIHPHDLRVVFPRVSAYSN
jgi:hypothetical protein